MYVYSAYFISIMIYINHAIFSLANLKMLVYAGHILVWYFKTRLPKISKLIFSMSYFVRPKRGLTQNSNCKGSGGGGGGGGGGVVL